MTIKKIAVLLLAVVICASVLASCGNKREDTAAETLAPLAPLDLTKRNDYTADEQTVAYLAELEDSFFAVYDSPVGDFEYTVENGTCTVTKYNGVSTTVRIPDTIAGASVTALGDELFADDEILQVLYIPDSVTTLGKNLLRGCTALKALHLPLTQTEDGAENTFFIGSLFGAERYEDNPRDVPATLKYLELGGSCTSLDEFALFECRRLELVKLPESLKHLGDFSLFGCESLLSVNVDSLTSVGEYALSECRALTVLRFGKELTTIEIAALEGCSAIRNLTLPFLGGSAESNTYLGYIFGAKVFDLSAGYYPQYLTQIEILPGCEKIDDYALYECHMLTTLKLPDAVKSIGARAFSGCLYLSEVSLPRDLTTVGDAAFFGCRSLTALDFSATKLNELGVNTFYFCDGLTAVVLPDTLTTLPSSSFAGCVKLASINLESVTKIDKNAFHGCPAFEDRD